MTKPIEAREMRFWRGMFIPLTAKKINSRTNKIVGL